MRTGGLDGGSPPMEKELFMKSKPDWVPTTTDEQHKAMPE
jgi:hypothetical protein